MDPRLLRLYERELRYIREMGAEFAQEYPKVAGRLGLEGFDCADPYVERLLEGFGFLAARVQLKLEAEFPRFTQHLLEIVYPHYLAPTPSMVVAQFHPDPNEGSLADGFVLPRGTVMRSPLGKGEQTPCEYRTAHELLLWPLEIAEAEYFTHTRDLAAVRLPAGKAVKSGIRIRLRTTAGLSFDKLALDSLSVFLRGTGEQPMQLYEQFLANAVAVVARPTSNPAPWHEVMDRSCIRRAGFTEQQALLPRVRASFQGYRLLHEYFAFPDRYMFVELTGLQAAMRKCKESELDVIVLLDRTEPSLQGVVDASNFALYCTPAINLFPRRADRIHLDDRKAEYHVIPDRTRPLDLEVYSVHEVVGHGASADARREFRPLYSVDDLTGQAEGEAFFSVRREPRLLSSKQKRSGPRSSYIGSEVFVSLVDCNEAPFNSDLRQLSFETWCTNRDLPLHMPVGQGETDFNLETGAPVTAVRCVAGPTRPRPSWSHGDTSWRLISHLSLNYLSLADSDAHQGAAALRELLGLYGDVADASIAKQIDGVQSVVSTPVTRRLPVPGPIAFGRGLEVAVTLDEAAFEGTGVFLIGALLDEFFSQYVSINSFAETVVKTVDRGEVMRWPVRAGRRQTL